MIEKRTRKILMVTVALLLMGAAFVGAVSADTSGKCGDNLTWTLDSDGLLTISGTGDMTDWASADKVPWAENVDSIKELNLTSGMTSIGSFAFCGCSKIGEDTIFGSIYVPDTVTKIGSSAFSGCSKVSRVRLPSGVNTIGDDAFNGCRYSYQTLFIYYDGKPSILQKKHGDTPVAIVQKEEEVKGSYAIKYKILCDESAPSCPINGDTYKPFEVIPTAYTPETMFLGWYENLTDDVSSFVSTLSGLTPDASGYYHLYARYTDSTFMMMQVYDGDENPIKGVFVDLNGDGVIDFQDGYCISSLGGEMFDTNMGIQPGMKVLPENVLMSYVNTGECKTKLLIPISFNSDGTVVYGDEPIFDAYGNINPDISITIDKGLATEETIQFTNANGEWVFYPHERHSEYCGAFLPDITEEVKNTINYYDQGGEPFSGTANPNPTEFESGFGEDEEDEIVLQDVIKPGKAFLGWYSDKGCTTKVTSITKNLMTDLYAKWGDGGNVESVDDVDITKENIVLVVRIDGSVSSSDKVNIVDSLVIRDSKKVLSGSNSGVSIVDNNLSSATVGADRNSVNLTLNKSKSDELRNLFNSSSTKVFSFEGEISIGGNVYKASSSMNVTVKEKKITTALILSHRGGQSIDLSKVKIVVTNSSDESITLKVPANTSVGPSLDTGETLKLTDIIGDSDLKIAKGEKIQVTVIFDERHIIFDKAVIAI